MSIASKRTDPDMQAIANRYGLELDEVREIVEREERLEWNAAVRRALGLDQTPEQRLALLLPDAWASGFAPACRLHDQALVLILGQEDFLAERDKRDKIREQEEERRAHRTKDS